MLDGYVATSFILAILFFTIGAIVFVRNPNKKTNRTYLIFSIFVGIWLVANFIASSTKVDTQVALIANRIVFVFGGLAVTTMFVFFLYLTKAKLTLSMKILVFFSLFTSLIGLSPLIVKDVFLKGDTYGINFGPLSSLYFLLLTIVFAATIINLVVGVTSKESERKEPFKIILIGITITFIGIFITNVALPVGFNYFGLANIGSYFAIFVVASMAYAIIKHRLFDIKFTIARIMTYGLLVSTLSAIYAVTVFVFASKLLDAESLFAQQVIPITTAIFLVFTAPLLRKLFDKITNRIFYQDAYDPQVFLDEFNKALLNNIELPILLRHSTTVIQENLKSQFCVVVVNEDGPEQTRIIGTERLRLSDSEKTFLRQDLANSRERVIAVDESQDLHPRLSRILKSKNIAVAVRLDASYRTGEDSLAYLMMGPKSSGSFYNKNDLKIIEIISDELVIAIQNALRFEEIQGFAATLQERVNDATASIKRTNEKLKEIDETKDEFISMASHQLRTPLTSVKGYLSMVLEGDVGEISEKQQKLLGQAFVSSQRMVYLIADLLNVSRLKTGKFVITPAPSDLAEMVQGEIDQLLEVAKSKRIKINYKKPKEFPLLMIDETKTRQVIMNFIDNAIYYTPSSGEVDVSVKEDKNHVYFTVKDNGIGVPKEDQKHLFTKFYRGSNARKTRPDGTGLGLFMAKRVIIAQEGTVLFESREGKGSTFGFSLNKSKLAVNQEN